VAALAITLASCAGPTPPARWAYGGTRLDLPAARGMYDGDPIEIRPLGPDYAQVLVDGDVELHIDRIGRVYDRYKRPIALLEADGRLVGMDEEPLGMVGAAHAALPRSPNAWLSLDPRGVVIQYGVDGTPAAIGQWFGCNGSPFSLQACLLVSHVLHYEAGEARTSGTGPAIGVGLGIGVGVGP
jgi:hypothetical protein